MARDGSDASAVGCWSLMVCVDLVIQITNVCIRRGKLCTAGPRWARPQARAPIIVGAASDIRGQRWSATTATGAGDNSGFIATGGGDDPWSSGAGGLAAAAGSRRMALGRVAWRMLGGGVDEPLTLALRDETVGRCRFRPSPLPRSCRTRSGPVRRSLRKTLR